MKNPEKSLRSGYDIAAADYSDPASVDGQTRLLRNTRRARDAGEHELKSAFRRLAKDSIRTATQATRPRAEVQGDQRGLRGPEGPAEAGGLRPVRPCRVREQGGGAAARRLRAGLRVLDVGHLRRSVRRFHGRPARRPSASAAGASAAPTCATTWRCTLEEAFAGKTAQIRCRPASPARHARARGAKAGTKPISLRDLRGHGKVRASAGLLHDRADLPDVPWARRDDQGSVPIVRGRRAGRARSSTLSVNIPAGVEDGTRIRLAGEGEAGLRGGPAGDLYIFLTIKPHEFFQRDGADIFCQVPISMTTAALGGQFEVPTLDGGRRRGSRCRKAPRPASSSG